MEILEQVKKGEVWIENDCKSSLKWVLKKFAGSDFSGGFHFYRIWPASMVVCADDDDIEPDCKVVKASELCALLKMADNLKVHSVGAAEDANKPAKEDRLNFPFKKGDWITVTERPPTWSDRLCPNSPISKPQATFPFTSKLSNFETVRNSSPHVAMDMGGYGWSYHPDIMPPATEEEINKAKRQAALPDGWKEEELLHSGFISSLIIQRGYREFKNMSLYMDSDHEFDIIKDSAGELILIARTKK